MSCLWPFEIYWYITFRGWIGRGGSLARHYFAWQKFPRFREFKLENIVIAKHLPRVSLIFIINESINFSILLVARNLRGAWHLTSVNIGCQSSFSNDYLLIDAISSWKTNQLYVKSSKRFYRFCIYLPLQNCTNHLFRNLCWWWCVAKKSIFDGYTTDSNFSSSNHDEIKIFSHYVQS